MVVDGKESFREATLGSDTSVRPDAKDKKTQSVSDRALLSHFDSRFRPRVLALWLFLRRIRFLSSADPYATGFAGLKICRFFFEARFQRAYTLWSFAGPSFRVFPTRLLRQNYAGSEKSLSLDLFMT